MFFFSKKPDRKVDGECILHITEKAVERANAELMSGSKLTGEIYHVDVYARNNLKRPTREQVAEAARFVMREHVR